MLVFFDNHVVVHREFIPQCRTTEAEFFCNVLRCLRENIWCEGMSVCDHSMAIRHRFFLATTQSLLLTCSTGQTGFSVMTFSSSKYNSS